MAWQWPGDKSLSEPMTVCLLMHLCITWPQWVKLWTVVFGFYYILIIFVFTSIFRDHSGCGLSQWEVGVTVERLLSLTKPLLVPRMILDFSALDDNETKKNHMINHQGHFIQWRHPFSDYFCGDIILAVGVVSLNHSYRIFPLHFRCICLYKFLS